MTKKPGRPPGTSWLRDDAGLTPREREVIVAVLVDGLNQKQTAETLGISRQAVGQIVKRLKERGLWQVPNE